jgi:hypothetical protein
MIINPVHFNFITKEETYIINPQNVVQINLNKSALNLRMRCTLRATTLSLNPIAGLSYVKFICVDPQHSYRFCADEANPLTLTHAQLNGTQRTSGNVLVRMYCAACHACGEISTHCWREYTGHYVCAGCVIEGMKAPYAYGTTTKKCCIENECGGGLYLYSEVPEKLYERVLGIYDKYKAS